MTSHEYDRVRERFREASELLKKARSTEPSRRLKESGGIEVATAGGPHDAATSPDRADRPVAVIIAHGMGQQVPFETLQDVTQALCREQERLRSTRPTVRIEAIDLGDARCHRAVMHVATGPQDLPPESAKIPATREAHIYECYWAPLTEGKISAWETFAFLIRSGFRGFFRGLAFGFRRFQFGGQFEFSLQPWVWLQFIGVVGVLIVPFLLAIAGVVRLVDGGRALNPETWQALTRDAGAAMAGIVLIMIGIGLPSIFHRRRRGGDHYRPLRSMLVAGLWVPTFAGLVLLFCDAISILLHAARMDWFEARWIDSLLQASIQASVHSMETIAHRLGIMQLPAWLAWVVHLPNLILWLSVVGAAWMASSILRQYVGDVAIYVSSHEVNRFGQTRQEILRRCADLATRVFQRGREGDWEYDRIVFVGHSLGSVIAYDVLNDLLLNDYTGQTALDVRARTLALLTFGSPLDKIAFLYRTQKGLGSDVREAGASSAQPLISHYGFRPPHWINLYNESDWISGSLDYFDDPAQPAAAGRAIANIRDGEAFIPFLAHTQYWETHPLPMLLHWLIRETGRGPVTAPLRVGSAAPAATAATAATATAEADHR